jgi:integrase
MSRMTFSAPAPLVYAGNNTLYCYTLPDTFPSLTALVDADPNLESQMNRLHRDILRVVYSYAARINEILRLTTNDIVREDTVLVTAEKGSRSYIILLPGLGDQIRVLGSPGGAVLLFPAKYIQVYRSARKCGLGLSLEGHRNRSVTHRARYDTARIVANKKGTSVASDVMRHRSASTIQYYLGQGGSKHG